MGKRSRAHGLGKPVRRRHARRANTAIKTPVIVGGTMKTSSRRGRRRM